MVQKDPFVEQIQKVSRAFTFRSMQNVIKYSKKSGYSMSHIGTLMFLHNKGFSAVSDIGDHLGITYPAVSQLLDKLVDEDMIERTEDPDDRRSKKIVLTSKGIQALHEGIRAREAYFGELSEKLSDDEKKIVMNAFEILLSKMEAPEGLGWKHGYHGTVEKTE